MENFMNILDRFIGKNILVIGDVMLDKYIEGDVSRISPEAPIPVVKVEKEFYEIGGAGNVVSNIASLGGNATLFSFVGKDKEAEILKKLLIEKKINYFFNVNEITTQKTRIIGKSQQFVRFDKEEYFTKNFNDETKSILIQKAEQADIIIISDYAKGTISEDLMNLLKNYKAKIIVNPKPKNKLLYNEVSLIISNEKETSEMSNHACSSIEQAGEKLKQELNSNLLITLGEKGMMLLSDKKIHIPTFAKEVYDVQGAGDTVVATVSLAIAAGASLEEAAILANHAAGITVEKKGTYSVSLKELKNEIFSEERKIVSLEELKDIVEDLKRKNKKIVWTNGCFDLLHIGHIKILKEAKKQGDILILGLDSDESIRHLKGPNRPVQSEKERAEILASMDFIDYISIYPPNGAYNYLSILKPDVYFKGGDYNINTINQDERKLVESYGGEIILGSQVPNKGTTSIIEKIKKENN